MSSSEWKDDHVFALKAQVDVAVILEHRDAVLASHFQHLLAPLQRHGPAQRVLEGWYGVQVFDPPSLALEPLDSGVQVFGDDAVLVALDAHDVRLVAAQRAQGAEVQELFGQHRVARVGESLYHHGDGFAGAAGQYQPFGFDLHIAARLESLRHQLPEWQVSSGVGVVSQIPPLPRQGAANGVGQTVQRQRVRVGIGHGEIVPGVAGLSGSHLRHSGGEQSLVAEFLWHGSGSFAG